MKSQVRLQQARPIGSGAIRDVYRHPDDAALLIKVVREATIDLKFGSGRRWYKLKNRRYRHLIGTLREVREQIAVQALSHEHPAFLQRIVGFVDTDIGPGLVVEAVFGRDGDYAPTLETLIRTGRYDTDAQKAFEKFADEVVASTVIVGDLHLGNLVYAHSATRGHYFVLIDGIGFKTAIPLERISPRINAISNRYRLRVLHERARLQAQGSRQHVSGFRQATSRAIRNAGLVALCPATLASDSQLTYLSYLAL